MSRTVRSPAAVSRAIGCRKLTGVNLYSLSVVRHSSLRFGSSKEVWKSSQQNSRRRWGGRKQTGTMSESFACAARTSNLLAPLGPNFESAPSLDSSLGTQYVSFRNASIFDEQILLIRMPMAISLASLACGTASQIFSKLRSCRVAAPSFSCLCALPIILIEPKIA